MHEIYNSTILEPIDVARSSDFIDWESQPSMFKYYPEFLFRYKFGEHTSLRQIELSRIITSTTSILGKKYNRLNTPSAGNLHPIELYVQIRGIKGVLSGIYHVDVGRSELVLIEEIESFGLEHSLNIQKLFNGIIFVVSCVPFRSEWKYSKRSIRYCYLDIGHQIAAINASATLFGQKATILSNYDTENINKTMGFKGDEFVCAVLCVGNISTKSVKPMQKPLMYVSPSDYSSVDGFSSTLMRNLPPLKDIVLPSFENLKEQNIFLRRSVRKFSDTSLDKSSIKYFMNLFSNSIYPLVSYSVVLKDDLVKKGIYLGEKMILEGDFSERFGKFTIDQGFIKKATIINIITSKHFSENKLMLAGAYLHKIYLQAQNMGVACSAIGAFYDKKIQKLLGIDDYILYVCAIGASEDKL